MTVTQQGQHHESMKMKMILKMHLGKFYAGMTTDGRSLQVVTQKLQVRTENLV